MKQDDSVRKVWKIQLRLIIIGIAYQTQHYAFGFIAAGSSILEDTHVTNFQYSVLSGPAMLFVSALTLMPLSRYSDYTRQPKVLLLLSTCVSAVFTGCYSLATDFYTLLWPRVLFSLSSSCISPLNLRIMADYHSIQRRGLGSSSYFLSIYIGLIFSSLMMLTSNLISWRITYIYLAGISLVASIITSATLKIEHREPEPSKASTDLKNLYKNNTLILCVMGLAFKYISQFTRSSFESLYFSRAFPDQTNLYSILNSVSLIICPWSVIIFGKLSDDLESRFPLIKPQLCAITLLIPIPFFIVMYLTTNFTLAMVCIFLASLVSEAYIGLSYAIMINVTVSKIKALQTAWMMTITMVIGGITILIIGITYNTLQDLRIALMVSGTLPLAFSAAMFLWLAKYYQKDLEEFQETEGNLLRSIKK